MSNRFQTDCLAWTLGLSLFVIGCSGDSSNDAGACRVEGMKAGITDKAELFLLECMRAKGYEFSSENCPSDNKMTFTYGHCFEKRDSFKSWWRGKFSAKVESHLFAAGNA